MTILDQLADHARERVAAASMERPVEAVRREALALPKGDFPENFSTALIGPRLGYVRRGGGHGISGYDWVWLLDFADGVLASK